MGDSELCLKGRCIIVPDEYLEEFEKYKWHFNKKYAVRMTSFVDGVREKKWLHREIWEYFKGNIPNGFQIDHINNNPTDNRLENLRLCTPAQNCRNATKSKRKMNSIYKGVYFENKNRKKKWRATIRYNKKPIHIGWYLTELEAARAYDSKAIELFGEFAKLNFEEGC